MYDIKLGQGCGIKATMLTPAGGVCDLRRARYIAASLVLVSGATMNCEDVTFNEVTNAVYVRLLGTRELTATGRYGIIFNVKLEDKTMYSTPVVWFAEVKEDAPTGYHELTLSLSLTVVNFPDNVSYTGASPKISDKNTWLVYDDDLNAYVDTGIEVGYANLLSRYDGKFVEIVVIRLDFFRYVHHAVCPARIYLRPKAFNGHYNGCPANSVRRSRNFTDSGIMVFKIRICFIPCGLMQNAGGVVSFRFSLHGIP